MSDQTEHAVAESDIPWSLLSRELGCCGSLKQGPFCQKCGKPIDRLCSLLAYITDRIEGIKTDLNQSKLPMWTGWQHALYETLRAINVMQDTQRRNDFMKTADAAYQSLKGDDVAWKEELAERASWTGL